MNALAKIVISTIGFNKENTMKDTSLCTIKDNEDKFSLSNKLIVSVSKFFFRRVNVSKFKQTFEYIPSNNSGTRCKRKD